MDSTVESVDVWRPIGIATLVAIVATFLPAGLAGWAGAAEPVGAYSWEWGNGAGRLAITLIALWIIAKRGWSEPAGVTSTIDRAGLRSPIALLVFAGSLVPLIGLLTTSWEAVDSIVAKVWYFGLTGPFEEIVFRSLLFYGLARYWAQRPKGLRLAAVVSAGLFAVLHINPIAVVITFIAGIAFTGLVVETRSIWPAVIAHSVYDILAEFPIDAAGVSLEDEAIGTVLALPFLLIAAVLAWKRLGRDRTNT